MKLVLLGTSAAVGGAKRDNTSLAFRSDGELILVDCPGAVTAKLDRAGFDFRSVSRVLLTHDHIDHIYGLPSLIHSLPGRQEKVELFGSDATLHTIEKMLKDVKIFSARNYPPVDLIPVKPGSDLPVFRNGELSCFAARARHSRETVVYRFIAGESSFVYCPDTGPSPEISQWSQGSGWLFHDTNAPHRFKAEIGENHSSAREAAQVASEAGVGVLVMIHIDWTRDFPEAELIEEAREFFPGRIVLPQDGQELDF